MYVQFSAAALCIFCPVVSDSIWTQTVAVDVNKPPRLFNSNIHTPSLPPLGNESYSLPFLRERWFYFLQGLGDISRMSQPLQITQQCQTAAPPSSQVQLRSRSGKVSPSSLGLGPAAGRMRKCEQRMEIPSRMWFDLCEGCTNVYVVDQFFIGNGL